MVGILMSLFSVSAALAVMMGAFVRHRAGSEAAPEVKEMLEVAVRYHFWHSLAGVLSGIATVMWPFSGAPLVAAACFGAGILFFSGTIYARALGGWSWLRRLTPLGGLAFILGWMALALSPWI